MRTPNGWLLALSEPGHCLTLEASCHFDPEGAVWIFTCRTLPSWNICGPMIFLLLKKKNEAAEPATVKDRTILVLEDEFIIAMELEDVLGMEHGAHVHIASTPQAALDILERCPVDGAILDINIAGESSFPVARVLSERGIPFLFATGCEAASSAVGAFSEVPVLAKPYTMSSVVAALRGMMRA